MLIDLHTHSAPISPCCRLPAPEMLEIAKETGLDGIVLTNHYQKSYIPEKYKDCFPEVYEEEIDRTKEAGKKAGIKVFGGIEISMELHHRVHMLVYGADSNFLKKHPTVYEYTQEALYNAVKEHGGILIHAHPRRFNLSVLDTRFLDGVEINCHPAGGSSYRDELVSIATENNLCLTCGGDYHADVDYRPKCGMYLPETIETDRALADFIINSKNVRLCIHEPGTKDAYDFEYRRSL